MGVVLVKLVLPSWYNCAVEMVRMRLAANALYEVS
jgi:hypothetical protein